VDANVVLLQLYSGLVDGLKLMRHLAKIMPKGTHKSVDRRFFVIGYNYTYCDGSFMGEGVVGTSAC